MTYRVILFFFLSFLFLSCEKERKKQFEFSGGTIFIPIEEVPSTISPNKVIDTYSSEVLNQVYDGLVSVNPKNLKIVPRIAHSWTESDNGKTYRFILRKDVYFHSNPCFSNEKERLLTPEDVQFSIENICLEKNSESDLSTFSFAFKNLLKGANDFRNRTTKKISGLKINGDTVTFELLKKDLNFLYKLADVSTSIVSKKAHQKGVMIPIGTGPFEWKGESENSKIVLTKNEDFYLNDEQGNALPYLDSLVFVVESSKLKQLKKFEEEKIDFIQELPPSQITKMLEGNLKDFNTVPPKLILENNALLETNFYFFNLKDDRFKDVRVRKAFNYAINREQIGLHILRNQFYELGNYGIVPPIQKSIRGYDFDEIKERGYAFDPEKAKALLEEAGYPNGEGFGSVTLRFNINDRNSSVAMDLANQLSNVLNVNVNIDGSTFDDLVADYENGSAVLYKLTWSADFPNPENFLRQFYAPNNDASLNFSSYNNPVFNTFFEKAISSEKKSSQLEFFNKAELSLLENPPMIVLWHGGGYEIKYSGIRNLYFNPLDRLDFTNVYRKLWTVEEYQKFTSEK